MEGGGVPRDERGIKTLSVIDIACTSLEVGHAISARVRSRHVLSDQPLENVRCGRLSSLTLSLCVCVCKHIRTTTTVVLRSRNNRNTNEFEETRGTTHNDSFLPLRRRASSRCTGELCVVRGRADVLKRLYGRV